MIILSVVWTLWMFIPLTEGSLTVIEVTAPGKDPYTPAQSNNSQYDIPANSTVLLKCELAHGEATLRYPTIDIAKYMRFNNDTRVTKDNGSLWILSDVEPYDTGAIECYDPVTDVIDESIYLYVYDPNGPLHVELRKSMVYYYRIYSFFPCLPTSSMTKVRMIYKGFNLEAEGVSICA
ncbi:uncharacterized protein [Watersipora subatra]|uniref:uncharacterized protein isoform X2 n=1 Tax=Watersipora subatra TaxID=2589382 RepID=UPI00355B87C3